MDGTQQRSGLSAITIGALIIIILAASIMIYLTRPEPVEITINPPLPTATPAPTHTPSPITVYVTGAVNNPQSTFTLPYGSRVQDSIDAAGGFTPDADLNRINLAGMLRDGDHIHVASNRVEQSDDVSLATPSGGTSVYVNTATVEELQSLPGIGSVTAQAIVDYRIENGPFTSIDDLDNVPGIGSSTIEEIAPLVSLD